MIISRFSRTSAGYAIAVHWINDTLGASDGGQYGLASRLGEKWVASILIFMLMLSILSTTYAFAQSRDAEPATRAANDAFLKSLPFSGRADFDDAKRGFIATLPDGAVAVPGGKPAFDTKPYAFLRKDEVPATVNPSQWRQAQLNAVNGLFKVSDRV
jgi:alkyl sulfatase BDS1-like metallo-beta-lactamase superfamily hydrolase